MSELGLIVAAAVVFATLLAAGCVHLVHSDRLARALRARGWPAGVTRPAGVVLAVGETALGAVGVLAVVLGPARLAPVVGSLIPFVAAVLFTAFAVDAGRVLRAGADVPCGCGATELPVNQWVLIRAVAYACLALVAALQRPGLGELAPLPAVTTIAAAGVIGLLLWLLPRALAIPPGFTLDMAPRTGAAGAGR